MTGRQVCLFLGSALCAAATTVYDVQFSTGTAQSGAAVIGAPRDIWNQLPGSAYSEFNSGTQAVPVSLVDTTTAASPLQLTYSDDGLYVAPPQFLNGFQGTAWESLMNGFLNGQNVHQGTVTLTGLTPDETYELYLYTQGDSAAGGRLFNVDVNGSTGLTSIGGSAAVSTFILGQNYLFLTPTADSLGNLVINFTGVAGAGVVGPGEGDLNGFQLVETPEPLGLASLSLGLLVLLGLKSRFMAAFTQPHFPL